MQFIRAIRQHFPQHKYAIHAKLLGDDAELAWTNLGYWDSDTGSYPQACRQLADHLAQAVNLTSSDHLLDLGCGRGASLLHWSQQYRVNHFSAVELQSACVAAIQQYSIPGLDTIYPISFLDLSVLPLSSAFDVILCIDAAYHHPLAQFLASVTSVLNTRGRLGFHYLIRSDRWKNLTPLQQQKYRYLLKSADIDLEYVHDAVATQQILTAYGFEQIQIKSLSAAVFAGFSGYIAQRGKQQSGSWLDRFKIQMTAQLCAKLYQDGVIEYVQITAQKQD